MTGDVEDRESSSPACFHCPCMIIKDIYIQIPKKDDGE
jgi:hypothetical protein